MSATATLRARLRADTRDAHQRVDDAFSRLDPGCGADLAQLLAALAGALAALEAAPGDGRAAAEALRDEMRAALAADLEALGAPPPIAPDAVRVGGLALLYVLLGSRAGTQLIARRWAGGDARAARAGRYLALDSGAAEWRALCQDLAARPAAGAAAERLLAEVRAVFAVFAAAHDLNAGLAADA